MSAYENIVIGKSSIPSLIITLILMIAIPVIFFCYWRIKYKQQTKISSQKAADRNQRRRIKLETRYTSSSRTSVR